MDGSRGLPIDSMNAFLVSTIDTIHFYDVDSFQEILDCKIEVNLLKKGVDEREPNEIITM